MASIYISSTYTDLRECREAVYHTLRSLHHDVIAMEHYVAAEKRPLEKCLSDLEGCEIYVGVFAWRYGYVPKTGNPEQSSITELEFRYAVKKGKTCLLFLLDENAPWRVVQIEEGAGGERIRKLREELSSNYVVSFFQNCDQLATMAAAAVTNACQNRFTSQEAANEEASGPERISIGRLPITGSDLFGRDQELELLDRAWASRNTHVFSLVAWGGVGKSTLTNQWLARMAKDNYRGAIRVYAWSFFSQGIFDPSASGDPFIDSALLWFGEDQPRPKSPWDRGELLAHLVGRHRTLLILDGIESLQNPPGEQREGQLKDPALKAFLIGLAAKNQGLCIVSTRIRLQDLANFERSTAPRLDLEHLTASAGAQILKAQGVNGDFSELKRASEEFGGHSLALTLLGSYLTDVFEGDVRRRNEVGPLEEEVRYGGHARRVMSSYEQWFGEGPELAVLRLLGLFNGPASANAITAIRQAPIIPGLTDVLLPVNERRWRQTLAKLRRANLLSQVDKNEPNSLETHPLVREHFGQQLMRELPEAWREANNRLYEHLKESADEFPDTIRKMTSLYAAVTHGCRAERHKEALLDVYWRRIQRKEESFNSVTLGAFGAELAILSNFFINLWNRPLSQIEAPLQSYLLNEVGVDLQSIGRLHEAIEPLEIALEMRTAQESWENASRVATNLCELVLAIGQIRRARSYAQTSVMLAERSRKSSMQVTSRAIQGHVLHQAGNQSEAETIFAKAEAEHKKRSSDLPILYALSGFYYCALLLDIKSYSEVIDRATQTIAIAKQKEWWLAVALDHISLGQALFLQSRGQDSTSYEESEKHLAAAVNTLRQMGHEGYLLNALLASARLSLLVDNLDAASASLDSVFSIATRNRMGLHLADCHIEYARLYAQQGKIKKARNTLAFAKKMIDGCEYYRRVSTILELESQCSD